MKLFWWFRLERSSEDAGNCENSRGASRGECEGVANGVCNGEPGLETAGLGGTVDDGVLGCDGLGSEDSPPMLNIAEDVNRCGRS